MSEYILIRTLGSRQDFCQLKDGYLHTTNLQLGREYPHLVRSYKTQAVAKGIITRILKKYSFGQQGTIEDYRVERTHKCPDS